MKSENDYDYFRDFFDLIPDPLAIVNKKTFKIYYVNQEFQYFVKKSFSLIKNTNLNELFDDELFFLDNLRETSKKIGIYFIREALIKDNSKISLVCIVTEKNNQNMMIIFKKENKTYKNDVFDDYGAYEHFFSIFVHEITNPLSSIKMASQLLEKSKTYDSELLEIIYNECGRITGCTSINGSCTMDVISAFDVINIMLEREIITSSQFVIEKQ